MKISNTIGRRILNVPHEVPVEKASPKATRKKIAGITARLKLLLSTTLLTYAPILR